MPQRPRSTQIGEHDAFTRCQPAGWHALAAAVGLTAGTALAGGVLKGGGTAIQTGVDARRIKRAPHAPAV